MCRRTTTWLRRLDWLGRLAFCDFTTQPAGSLPVSLETAMGGMPMVTREGRVLVGFPAVRRAGLQTPLGFLPASVLYVPGVSHLGRWVYGMVAASRGRDACSVPGVRGG